MKQLIISITLALMIFSSCGPSKEEIEARETFKNDSISRVAKQELLDEQAFKAEQDSLKQQLMFLKGQLAAAEVTMQDLQQPKLFRSSAKKAEQIAAQTIMIEQLKSQITETEKLIKH